MFFFSFDLDSFNIRKKGHLRGRTPACVRKTWGGPQPRAELGSAQQRCYRWQWNVSGAKVFGFKGKRLFQKQEKVLQTIRLTPAGCPVLSPVARRIRTTECECVFVWIRDVLSAGRGEIKQMCPLFIPFFNECKCSTELRTISTRLKPTVHPWTHI